MVLRTAAATNQISRFSSKGSAGIGIQPCVISGHHAFRLNQTLKRSTSLLSENQDLCGSKLIRLDQGPRVERYVIFLQKFIMITANYQLNFKRVWKKEWKLVRLQSYKKTLAVG